MQWVCLKNSLTVLFILVLCSCQKTNRDEARIYLASSLTPIADDIKALMKNRVSIDLMFLNSSAIAKQIENGAPCDVAIVADDMWSSYLLQKGYVARDQAILARNSLVVAGIKAQLHQGAIKTLFQTLNPTEKVIIADENYVPLGSYTKQALEQLGVWNDLLPRFVRAHSARHAMILLKSGLGQLAVVYRTDALHDNVKIYGTIESALHRPITYPVLVCRRADPKRAYIVKDLLFSPEFYERLKIKGFFL